MNFFTVSTLITATTSLLFGIFVLYRNKKSSTNKLWALVCMGVFVWQMGLFLELLANSESEALLWNKVLYIGAILIPIFYYHFIISLLNLNKKNKIILILGYFLAIIFLFFNIFTKLLVSGVPPAFEFKYWVEPGPLYYAYFGYFALFFSISFYRLFKYFKLGSFLRKQQIKYVLLSGLFGVGGGITVFFPQFFGLYPIGNYFVILYLVLVTYAIAKYRLMNVRFILTRSILYGILVGSIASFFALSVLVVGEAIGGNTQTSKIITYLVNALIVVIFLNPVKRVWAKITDRIFYKDKVDYQDLLQETGSVIAKEIDLQKLLQALTDLLRNRLKVKSIAIFIPFRDTYNLIAKSGENPQTSISKECISYVKNNHDLVIVDELIRDRGESKEDSPEYHKTNKLIEKAEAKKVEMMVPIVEQDRVTAIMLFSAKNSGDLYSDEDVDFLKVVVPQIATAIEKSKLYEEVEEQRKGLEVKVEERTKSLKEANISLEDRNKFLSTMQVVTGMISRSLDLKKVNQSIANSIASELGYVGGMLSFVNKAGDALKLEAITQNKLTEKIFKILPQDPFRYRSPLKEGYNLGVQTFLTGKINFSGEISDFLSPPIDKSIIDGIQKLLRVKTVVCVPIFSEAKIIGIINFFLKTERNKISSLDIEAMTALANQVGLVSRNLQLYKTIQKANRDLQEANVHLKDLDTTKSEFLSIASHQLRTPISALKGYLDMILEGDFGKISPEIKKVIANLFESSSRLARLVNVFLNVSRIESGRLKLEKKPLQINDLIKSVIEELINQAKQKGLKLNYKKSSKLPPLINADSDKLREVVLNLVDNSIKYTPKGSLTISVEHDDKELKFIVKDTGIGIDPKEVKGLFRKFVRGSGVAQIHTGGSGLGLFIAQKIIKEHGGTIWAESEGKDKGSKFQFKVPLYKKEK